MDTSTDAKAAFGQAFVAGVDLHRTGRLTDAVALYERAIAANADVPEAHGNRGAALAALERFDEALAALQRALALRPDYPAALDNLGLVRGQLDQPLQALALHQRAVELEPTNAKFQTHLGTVLLALHRYADARAAFETAVGLAPHDAVAHNGLGLVLERQGHYDDADAVYRTALALDPNFAEALGNLGASLLQTGDTAAALELLERACALDPRDPRFHRHLVVARSGNVDDAQLAQLEQIATELDTIPGQRQIALHFALAAVYERRGRDDEAFAQWLAGNARKRTEIRYDEREVMRRAAAAEALYTAPFLEGLRGCGNPSARPIFVFGMPRSGTTLVEQLLAAQPAVAAAGELRTLDELAREPAHAIVPGMARTELAQRIRAIGDNYVAAIGALDAHAAHVTDKMPENFWYAPLIHLALPNARMIHVRRDRLDTCLSCFATPFVDQGMPYSYDLGELGRYYRAYEAAMAQWRTLLPPERFLEVDYERVVEDFDTEARRILTFCGLPWDDATRAFHAVSRRVRTASLVQVRRPLYSSSVGRSRKFAAHLGLLIEALGD